MVVQDVLVNALNPVRVEVIDADVKVKRHDGHFVADQDGFGLLKKLFPLLQVGFLVGLPDELVVARIFPAGAVVAVVAGEQAQKRVRVVVVADPARTRQVVIQLRLGAQIDLPFDLPQIHLDAELVAPHLLQFDGDLLVNFCAAARRRVEHVLKARKSLAAGITGLGQQLARQRRDRNPVPPARCNWPCRRGRDATRAVRPPCVIFLTMRSLSIASASAWRTRGSSNGLRVTLNRMK